MTRRTDPVIPGAWSLSFNSSAAGMGYDDRCYGFTVRAVQSN